MMSLKRPIEGIWFRVNPEQISKKIFEFPREDFDEEWTRKRILEAFYEWRTNWKRYGIAFDVMILKKTWNWVESYEELSQYSYKWGHQADWVEFYMLLAHRIEKEGWKAICEDPDTDKFHKIVLWKNGKLLMVGGSTECDDNSPPSTIWREGGDNRYKLSTSVPLVARW